MRNPVRSLGLLMLLCAAPALQAELNKAERKEAKAYLSGTLYTRVDIPCGTGRHPMGTYKVPLVEVSPDAVNTDNNETFQAGWYHAQSTYWGIAPNDTLQLDEMEFDEDTAEIELEGVGKTDGNDTVVKFVNIRTLDDFKKAADRKLEKGMTKRQVFYVTGSPESVSESEEKGKKVEVWTLRQNKGMQIGFWTMSTGAPAAGMPKTLRFVDGKLEDFEAKGAGGLKLDE